MTAQIQSPMRLFVPTLLLILLGAFTKSAQFPFHFWLPNAMAAPTPRVCLFALSHHGKSGHFLGGTTVTRFLQVRHCSIIWSPLLAYLPCVWLHFLPSLKKT